MDQALAELQDAVKSGRCVLVIGTGVSSAVSGEPKASWTGLLKDGIDYAASVRPVQPDWRSHMENLLELAANSHDYLDLASDLVNSLGGSSSPDFSAWLRRSVGYLEARQPDIARTLTSFDFPLITTNYDDLLEKVSGRDYVTWRDAPQFQRVLAGQTRDVAHLHGHWRRPDSVVFTSEQYELMMADRGAMALRNSMAAINTMIYVGFGEGMSDPNFSNLRQWISDVLPYQEVRHFRLCLARHREALLKEHVESGDRILPVSYGDDYADLGPFLEDLLKVAGSGGTLIASPISALEVLEEEVRDSAVLTPHLRDPDSARVFDLLIPPVLLPMPHTQYVAALREDAPSRPKRCDLEDEVKRDRVIVVGEEHVGVSSALLWLAARQSVQNHDLVPVKVDYRKVGPGKTPLRREIIRQMRFAGRHLRPDDPLPDLILVLDNVHASNAKTLDRVISDLSDVSLKKVIIGCRSGTELELARVLDERGVYSGYTIRYMGRLNVSDVRQLTSLVASTNRAQVLAEAAASVVRTHHLPSTPFTFSMIVSAIIRGESLVAAASPTALLDAYLDLLLGRGATDDDSRLGMDAFGRSFVLSRLAEEFVFHRAGSLSQGKVIDIVSQVFDQLDWNESPVDVVKDLQARHVLLINGGEVAFSQSSYLHLFAAKRALDSPEFLDFLKEDPVYYAPIVNHYGALKRTDAQLIKDLLPLLDKFDPFGTKPANVFVEVVQGVVEGSKLEKRLADEAEAARHTPDADTVDPLDERDDDDRVPFPLEPVGTEPTIILHMQSLDLLSSLLRDTEIITDHLLKEQTLIRLLRSWGQFVSRMEAEAGDSDGIRDAMKHLAEQIGIPERKIDEFLAELRKVLPISLALSGISTTLSSRKLVKTIERSLAKDELMDDPAFAILATFLLMDVRAPEWVARAGEMLDRYGKVDAVASVYRRLVFAAYIGGKLEPQEETSALDFLVEQTMRQQGLEPRQKQWVRAQLERRHLTHGTREKLRSMAEDEDDIVF